MKTKRFSLKFVCGHYVLKRLKEHSAVVISFGKRGLQTSLKTFTK